MQAPSRTALAVSCLAVLFFLSPTETIAQTRLSFHADDADPNTDLLEIALAQRGSLHVVEMPLKDVADELSRQFSVPIRLSLKKLEEASVSPDTPVNIQLFHLPFESILRHALADLELCFTTRDGVLLITTPEDAESQLMTRVYPVLDLVAQRFAKPAYPYPLDIDGYTELIDVITMAIAPDTWDSVGGPGAVGCLDNAGALVISQTRDVHRQVEGLLTSLRRTKSYQGLAPRDSSPIAPVQAPVSYSPPRLPIASPADVHIWQLPQVYRREK